MRKRTLRCDAEEDMDGLDGWMGKLLRTPHQRTTSDIIPPDSSHQPPPSHHAQASSRSRHCHRASQTPSCRHGGGPVEDPASVQSSARPPLGDLRSLRLVLRLVAGCTPPTLLGPQPPAAKLPRPCASHPRRARRPGHRVGRHVAHRPLPPRYRQPSPPAGLI